MPVDLIVTGPYHPSPLLKAGWESVYIFLLGKLVAYPSHTDLVMFLFLFKHPQLAVFPTASLAGGLKLSIHQSLVKWDLGL